MLDEYPFYPELTEAGKKQAQDLMDKFEKSLKEQALKIMSEITTDFYCNVLNEIESDHWVNYRSKIVNTLCDYKNKNNNSRDFDKIRMAIYRKHKPEIVKDLNQDLLDRITELEGELKEAYIAVYSR